MRGAWEFTDSSSGAILPESGQVQSEEQVMTTQFNVNDKVSNDDMRGKTVLVFLKPQGPQRDYHLHAWQVLNGAPGSTASFAYEELISTDISGHGANDGKSDADRKPVLPGQLLSAASPSGMSPLLQPAAVSLAQSPLAPQQCGVISQAMPAAQFEGNWYVNDKPVVTMPQIDPRMTASFEYLPNFYFMVATPPMMGQTYVVQNFSDVTQYVAPITATEVDVTLDRKQDR